MKCAWQYGQGFKPAEPCPNLAELGKELCRHHIELVKARQDAMSKTLPGHVMDRLGLLRG